MKDLINLVLDVRKMEVGESKFIFDKYPLNQWIQETGQDFMDEGNEKHIQLSFQLDPHITEVVYDQDKLMIVVSNLLINALKHSPEHSTIRVSTQLFPSEQYVKISVSD